MEDPMGKWWLVNGIPTNSPAEALNLYNTRQAKIRELRAGRPERVLNHYRRCENPDCPYTFGMTKFHYHYDPVEP